MENEALARRAVDLCRRRGADEADALVMRKRENAFQVFYRDSSLAATSDTTRITLRVFSNHKGAIITGRGASEPTLEAMVAQAVTLAEQSSRDKFLGLAEAAQQGRLPDDLGIYDQALADLSLADMEETASRLQSMVAARDSRVASLTSATFQAQTHEVTLCTSQGYCQTYKTTLGTLGTNAVLDNNFTEAGAETAGADGSKLVGGANVSSRTLGGLSLDRLAEQTVEKLAARAGAKPAGAGWFPVVFAPTASRSLAAILLQFCSGPVAMYMEGSYFGKLGEQVCSPLITLVDDPLKPGGLKTSPFDHEGVAPRRKVIIERGVFSQYLLNAYYGRVLERDSTGNAVSTDDVRLGVAPSNAYIAAGEATPESLLADVRQGFYVTKLTSRTMHVGANFTQAATGMWVENGKLTHAVRAAIISMPLKDLFKNIAGCGNDLEHDAALAAPTLLVGKMNLAPLA
jgi:PmbA protein